MRDGLPYGRLVTLIPNSLWHASCCVAANSFQSYIRQPGAGVKQLIEKRMVLGDSGWKGNSCRMSIGTLT